MTKPDRRTSEILQDIIRNGHDGRIRIDQFMAILGDRAFALGILIFSLPNSLPVPGIPGFSTVTGLPITFIALQMIVGRPTVWLPQAIAEKQFSQAMLKKILNKAMPFVMLLERFLHPCWGWMVSPLAERGLGVMFAVLSLIIALPIPGGNFLPGLSMSLLALGMLEKDGRLVLGALAFSSASVLLMVQVITFALATFWGWVAGLF